MIKDVFKRTILIIIVSAVLIGVLFVMLQYEVEGEKHLPFSINKVLLVSTVDGQVNDDSENIWNISIEQVNDIYIYLEKTVEDDSQTIKEIKFENFNLLKEPQKGKIKLLRPTGDMNNLYAYSEEDYLSKGLTYTGGRIDDMKSLEVSNDGGVLGFRLCLTDLGNFISNDAEEISYDGTLLSGLGVTLEEINFNVAFDIIITTSENISYKGTINIELPLEGIIENGTENKELVDFENVVFKRI